MLLLVSLQGILHHQSYESLSLPQLLQLSVLQSVDVSPPIACHGGTWGSMFGLRRMPNSMVNARDSRFILVQALDRRSSNNLTSSRR